MLSENSLAGRA